MFDAVIKLFQRGGWKALTPITPVEVRTELGKSKALEPMRRSMLGQAQDQQAAMHAEHGAIARANARIEHKAMNGLGELHARIPLTTYTQMQKIYGEECWEDPAFLKAFLRDNPLLKVKTSRGTRGQSYVRDPMTP